MKYKCVECGFVFGDDDFAIEKGYVGTCGDRRIYEEYYCCPICKGDYEEISRCEVCGEYACESGERYCEECKTDALKRFQYFLRNEFTEKEREMLNDLYDGEPF